MYYLRMKLSYKQVQYLDYVARCGGITAASRRLNISQSSVLAAVDAAENAVGVRLFVRRKGHGFVPTPAGQTFMVNVRRFLAAGDDFYGALDRFPDRGISSLRVGCFTPLGALVMPPVMHAFLQAESGCALSLYEGNQTQLRAWLREGLVDMIVTYDIGEEFSSSVTPICRFPIHAVLHRSDPKADARSISLAELAKRPLILLDLPETRVYLTSVFDLVGNRPVTVLRTSTYDTVRACVASGLGMSLLNVRPMGSSSPDSPDIVRLPLSDQLRHPTLIAVDIYGDTKPKRVRKFARALYDHYAQAGPERFAIALPDEHPQLLCNPP